MDSGRFDFGVVKRQIHSQYRYAEIYWSEEEVVEVFRCFYECYRMAFHEDHPRLSNANILKIICALPIDDEGNEFIAEEYPDLIEAYFNTEFYHCNYSMLHFMSGQIRMIRAYDLGYLP